MKVTIEFETHEQESPIKEVRKWNPDSVRRVCIDNDLYTAGGVREYSKMFDFVEENEPTDENIYRVSKDILEHSDEQTIENVMFLIGNRAVTRFYDVGTLEE